MTLLLALACTPEAPPPPPDMLVVVLDTVRADRLATYGYERDTSYQLDQIAAAGVVFEDASVSGAWTWPGHAALFTGEPPWVSGAHYIDTDAQVPIQRMRTDLPTLAEQLGAAGYRTESHATNWLLDPSLGLLRGFESAGQYENDQATVQAASAALDKADNRPLLLFVNLGSAHAPYRLTDGVPWSDAHKSELLAATDGTLANMRVSDNGATGLDPGQDCDGYRCDLKWTKGELEISEAELATVSDLYDANLVRLDNALRSLIQVWTAQRGGVVAITSDHGELFGEHRMLQHRLITLPGLLHVPLVLVGPGVPAGTRNDTPVQMRDLNPTLRRLAGLETEGWTLLDGLDGTPRPGPIEAAAWPDPRTADVPLVSQPWGYVREGDAAVAVSGDRVLQLGEGTATPTMIEAARTLPTATASTDVLGAEALKQLEALGYL
ncbi:MAG: sulfatase-like hydrolase/transferase [Proteobacteria bacterium]|nr:sulfatase-like hydrolase/transferase [Pseudomonadota bacterium]MCP4919600.1 sulfatase-like hydrolase/transferase [Pseudomonadota bacterium]